MDKRRIKIAMKVLHEVKEYFSETKEFIDDCTEQERLKENITLEELWRGSENVKKTKRLNEEEIKQQMIHSFVSNDTIEIKELNERADRVKKPEDAEDIIKQYEEIFRTKRKGIISVGYHQGKVFSHFREQGKFNWQKFLIFKMNVSKLIEKHLRLMKSSVTSSFLKNYFKDIKRICRENSSKFD